MMIQQILEIQNVFLYTSHIENNIFSVSIEKQESECKNHINMNKWKIIKYFSDFSINEEKLFERQEIQKLLIDIKKNKLKNCALVLYSASILGTDMLDVTKFMDILERKKISIFNARDNIIGINGSGIFTLHVELIAHSYISRELNKIYLVFSSKNNTFNKEDFYKGSFIFRSELENLLKTKCKDDKYIYISSPGNMKESFEYTCSDKNVLSNEINICSEKFYKEIMSKTQI
jgi:hypothetical protein